MQFAISVVRFIEGECPEHATSDALTAMLARLDARRAVPLTDVCEFLRTATYPDPATGVARHFSGWRAAALELERHFGGQ